jgi:hypothetical protein
MLNIGGKIGSSGCKLGLAEIGDSVVEWDEL